MKVCSEPGCPELVDKGRCPVHKREYQRIYDKRRGTPAQRGYNSAWAKRSKQQRETVPYCQWCNSTVDLTADHLEPGNPASPLVTACRSCNSRRAQLGKKANHAEV